MYCFFKEKHKNEIIAFMPNCIARSKLIENPIKEVFLTLFELVKLI